MLSNGETYLPPPWTAESAIFTMNVRKFMFLAPKKQEESLQFHSYFAHICPLGSTT